MGGRISWMMVAVLSIAVSRGIADEPALPNAANPKPTGIPFAADVQYFPAAPERPVVLTANESASKAVQKPAAEKAPAVAKPDVAAAMVAPSAPVSSPLSKQRRQRRAQWSTVLQTPADIALNDDAKPMTLGELLERIHQQHGLPVRIDLAHVLPMASMAEMTTARLTPKRSSNATVGMPSPLGVAPIGFIQTYSSEPYSGPVTSPPAYAPAAILPTNPTSLSPAQPWLPAPLAPAVQPPVAPMAEPFAPTQTYKPVALAAPTENDAAEAPVSAIQAQIVPETSDAQPGPSLIKEAPQGKTEEKAEPHVAARAIQAMLTEMLSTPVDAGVIQQPGATVEDILRQAFDRSFPLQALINASLAEELPMLASLSRATEWDLLILDDGVLLTTKLNANLHKETRVYSTRELEKTAGLKAEEVARVLTRTVRPWSWKKNFPDAVAAAKPSTESKPSVKTGKALTIPKIDLSLLGLLFSARSPLPRQIRLTNDDASASPITITPSAPGTENVELTTEQLEMLGHAWEGLVQLAVSSVQVIYHADPPTGVVEVLPGMLVISQSQGAHREIADLLEQLSQPEN